jgi:hypothetical protein
LDIVHVTHRVQIAEHYLLRTDTNDRPIALEELVEGLRLVVTKEMAVKPRIRYSGIPGARHASEWGGYCRIYVDAHVEKIQVHREPRRRVAIVRSMVGDGRLGWLCA